MPRFLSDLVLAIWTAALVAGFLALGLGLIP